MEILKSEPLILNATTDEYHFVGEENERKIVTHVPGEEEVEINKMNLLCSQQYNNNSRQNNVSSGPNVEDIFTNLQLGLTNEEWKIRYKTLTSLLKLIPTFEFNLQSEIVKEIFRLVTINLGNVVPKVRKTALKVIIAFIEYSKNPESVLKDMVVYGLDTTTTDTKLSLNTVQVLPKLLKTVKIHNESETISHQLLVQVVTSLSKRMVQITHQRQVVVCLMRIKTLIGETLFDHFLETYYPHIKRDFDILCNVYDGEIAEFYSDDQSDECLSDSQSAESDAEFSQSGNLVRACEDRDCEFPPIELHQTTSRSFESNNDDDLSYYANSDDDVIMKVYDEDGTEIKRGSSRRVTFGGEVVKIRTPDSEATTVNNEPKEPATDLTTDLTIQISSDESLNCDENGNALAADDRQVEKLRRQSNSRSGSRIPLPIRPALHEPKHPKTFFRHPTTASLNGGNSRSRSDYDMLMEIPIYEGESLTSSSDSGDQCRTFFVTNNSTSLNDQRKMRALKNNVLTDLKKMKITDKLVLENIFKKKDWRFYVCGIERLSQILRQLKVIQSIAQSESTTGVSLLCYVFNTLAETGNNRVINSSLQTLKILCQLIDSSVLASYLEIVVPKFCSYLGCTQENVIRSEAADILQMLMKRFSPQTIINVLFTENCFGSKSSKMRENSLLCLMYALLTFPSTEFNANDIVTTLIRHGIREPKRRVRQALLDTLSILGQFLPKSQFNIEIVDEETKFFKKALRARLARRQLPTMLPNSVILYAFEISPSTAFGTDIEWVLRGQGSLSENYSKSKAQFNFAHGDDISPLEIQNDWNHSDRKKTSNGYSTLISKPNENCNNFMNRGSSEEGLYSHEKLSSLNKNRIERYSADWTDSRYSSSLLSNTQFRFPSNFSDTSSYASSYTSEQNFPRLNPGYESNLMPVSRPVSENKLNQLNWTSKCAYSSKIPLRLEPTVSQMPIYYGCNVSSSLPILNDRKENNSLLNFYRNNKPQSNQFSSDNANKSRLLKNQDNKQYEQHETETENVTNNSVTVKNNDCITESMNIIHFRKNDEWFTGINNELNMKSKFISKDENKNQTDKIDILSKSKNRNSMKTNNLLNQCSREKPKKFLEKKTSVRLKRSLTKEIKIPQSTFSVNPENLPPFENSKDGLQKTLLKFENNDWENIIEALEGVIRLTRHHSKQLSICLHPYIIAVSKEIRNLRSQVARAACLAAENIFKFITKISDQDIEELIHGLFLRAVDTNKFLREDSNKALDAMVENIKFSKCVVLLTQKIANHPNALIRATTARLLLKLIQFHGVAQIFSLTKDKKEMMINTAVKFIMDSNSDARAHGRDIFITLLKDRRVFAMLNETLPSNVMISINKILTRASKK